MNEKPCLIILFSYYSTVHSILFVKLILDGLNDSYQKLKAKGLAVLSEVALTKAEQLKLATKRTKKDFHISHASGSGNRVDSQSKVPDEQQQKSSST
ncbi:hypothetical protein Tco_1051028, partial [Tanacetum coccineum]